MPLRKFYFYRAASSVRLSFSVFVLCLTAKLLCHDGVCSSHADPCSLDPPSPPGVQTARPTEAQNLTTSFTGPLILVYTQLSSASFEIKLMWPQISAFILKVGDLQEKLQLENLFSIIRIISSKQNKACAYLRLCGWWDGMHSVCVPLFSLCVLP